MEMLLRIGNACGIACQTRSSSFRVFLADFCNPSSKT